MRYSISRDLVDYYIVGRVVETNPECIRFLHCTDVMTLRSLRPFNLRMQSGTLGHEDIQEELI